MPPVSCLRSLAQLSLDTTSYATHASIVPRLLRPHAATFSTSAARHAAVMKKKSNSTVVPKKGSKSLRIGKKKPMIDMSKRPAQGERKALRKRIVLSNNNALEVPLTDLSKNNVLSQAVQGRVMGLPAEDVVDKLRAVDAFKPSQGWGLFRRPAVLMRREAAQLASLFKEVEGNAEDAVEGTGSKKKTIRRILTGERMSGKSTLLLQSLSIGFLRNWFVINIPEAQDVVNAHTEYAPLEKSHPLQYTQDEYTSALLQKILKSNKKFLGSTKLSTKPSLPTPLPAEASLEDLVSHGANTPEVSWPVFVALWTELSLPGRPPILFALDGLSGIMRNSAYLSADVKPIHAHDLTLVRQFVDHLSGAKSLPNGGIILGATSKSNSPTSPALDFSVEVAELRQKTPDAVLPEWNAYKKVDARVMDVLKNLRTGSENTDIITVGGLTKEEARSLIEYYAQSGLLRHQVNNDFVGERWSLAGMGNVGELERASVRLRV